MAKSKGGYLGASKPGKGKLTSSSKATSKKGGRYSTRKMKSDVSCPKPAVSVNSGGKVKTARKTAKGKKTRPK